MEAERKSLAEKIQKIDNAAYIKQIDDLYKKLVQQDDPKYQNYAELVKATAYSELPEDVWKAIVMEKDIILDTNGIFKEAFRYLVFESTKKYEEYIQPYRKNLTGSVYLDPYTDQYRIIPLTKKQSLVFEITKIADQEHVMPEMIKHILDFFKINPSEAVLIDLPDLSACEVVIPSIVDTFDKNHLRILAFKEFVKKIDSKLSRKICEKEVVFKNDSVDECTYIRIIQTRPVRNLNMKEIKSPVFNFFNVVNNNLNVNNNSTIVADNHGKVNLTNIVTNVIDNAINNGVATDVDANDGNMSKQTVVVDQKDLKAYIVAHPPDRNQNASDYYKLIEAYFEAKCNTSDIRSILMELNYSKRIINGRTKWRLKTIKK